MTTFYAVQLYASPEIEPEICYIWFSQAISRMLVWNRAEKCTK